jgi:hypothetical protein
MAARPSRRVLVVAAGPWPGAPVSAPRRAGFGEGRRYANLASARLLVCPAFLIGGEGRKYIGVLLDLDFDRLETAR